MIKIKNIQNWTKFAKRTTDMPPRAMLLKALSLFGDFKGYAIELGIGSGVDTIHLLKSGWKVLAIDCTIDGYENIKANVPEDNIHNLEFRHEYFENVTLPPADLIYSSYSIPFCKPKDFDVLMEKIINSLKPNGRFAGNLFGDKDEWVGNKNMTFLTREQVLNLFDGLEIEYFKEIHEVFTTVLDGDKLWHLYNIVAKQGG